MGITKALPFEDWKKLNPDCVECEDCSGTGVLMGGDICPECDGSGDTAYNIYLDTLQRERELLSINYKIKAEVRTCNQLNTTDYKQKCLPI